jgi:uncharacterized protein involved in exopolysaccharide biosynthesis
MTMLRSAQPDTVDVAELAHRLRSGWRAVLIWTLTGLAVAALIVAFVPAWFTGTASAVIRAPEAGASLLSKLGGSAASALLPGAAASSPIETEVQILSSRTLAARAVDSLLLQVRVRAPVRAPADSFFSAANVPGAFKRKRLHFDRSTPTGPFRVTGGDDGATASPGVPMKIAGGQLTLRSRVDLPPNFDINLYDHEEAITRLLQSLLVSKPGGEVISVAYRGDDSLTAARVPNLLMDAYLTWRRTSDRGANARRVEFLTAQVDSLEGQLRNAESALRRDQEKSGVVDPAVVGKLELERAGELRGQLGALDVERGALAQLQRSIADGTITSRQLAAFPSFLKSPGINELLGQLSALESKRYELLGKFTPEDPQVQALGVGIKNLEGQLPPLAAAYLSTLDKQRNEVSQQLDTLRVTIEHLPAVGETAAHNQRTVLTLAQVSTALRAQLVEARVAAIGEGGDVRMLDVARPPRKPSFPEPLMTMGIGAGVGVVIGVLWAILLGAYGRFVPDARAIERQIGVPALSLETGSPLLVAGAAHPRTLLLVPLDGTADTSGVADRLMRTATTRGIQATVLDLAAGPSKAVPTQIDRLSGEFDLVVVRTPSVMSEETLAALDSSRPVIFVATAGRIPRAELTGALEMLRRASVPCAGVVLSRGSSNGKALVHG